MSEPQHEAGRGFLSAPGQPDGILIRNTVLTEKQYARLKADWERKRHGHPKVLGLTRRVRLRLAWTHAVDSAAIWLADHHMLRVAELLWWRGCGRRR